MRERGLPHVSFPQALGELFIGPRHGVVVVGTHGKTTTSADDGLRAPPRRARPVLPGGRRDPRLRLQLPARAAGTHFVVEGDEYDTAYFDKGPKFLHYRPRTAIFTSCELDHADIYRDEAHYESAFERFVELLPADGFLAACATWESVLPHRAAGPAARSRPTRWSGRPTGRRAGSRSAPDGARFRARAARARRSGRCGSPVGGAHNVENALGVAAAATAARALLRGDRGRARGLPGREAAPGGARRRGRRHRDRRLRPPPHRGGPDARRHPGLVPRGAAAGVPSSRAPTPAAATCTRRSTRGASARRPRSWLLRPGPDRPGAGGGAARRGRGWRADITRARRAGRGLRRPWRRSWPRSPRGRGPGDVVVAMSNGAFGGDLDEAARGARGRGDRRASAGDALRGAGARGCASSLRAAGPRAPGYAWSRRQGDASASKPLRPGSRCGAAEAPRAAATPGAWRRGVAARRAARVRRAPWGDRVADRRRSSPPARRRSRVAARSSATRQRCSRRLRPGRFLSRRGRPS